MRRIDRYFLAEMSVPALVGVMMVLLLLVGNQLYGLLYTMYQVGAGAGDVARILLYYVPGLLMQAIPASLLLGTALSINRLERDREMLALRMTGTRLFRLILPYLLMGVLFSGVLAVLQETIVPRSTLAASRLTAQLAMRAPVALVPRDIVFRAGDTFLYVQTVDPASGTLRGITALKRDFSGTITLMAIPVAVNQEGTWLLRNDPLTGEPPRIYTFDAQNNLKTAMECYDGGMLNLKQEVWQFLAEPRKKPEEFTFAELRALQQGVRGSGYGITNWLALDPKQLTFHLHKKVASPLAALVAVLLAIPLSVRFGRSGGYMGLLLSGVIAFVFVVSSQWMQVLAMRSLIHPIFAAWAPGALFGLLGMVLLSREQ